MLSPNNCLSALFEMVAWTLIAKFARLSDCPAPLSFAAVCAEMLPIKVNKVNKPLTWKRFIDDVFCLWDTNKEEIEHFVEQANSYHPTIKFTAEVSQLETTVYKGERFEKESIFDVRTH